MLLGEIMKPNRSPASSLAAMDATPWLPTRRTLAALRKAVQACQGCPLYVRATQAVFGEGNSRARLLILGEVPGDQEDRSGHPFVGPAGRLLDEALTAAGLSHSDVYLTNAVKHFKSTGDGKRRLHAKPSAREIRACGPWWRAEVQAVHPQTILCLGATAAQAVLGNTFRIIQHHGQVWPSLFNIPVMATYHPAAVLRSPRPEERQQLREWFFADLRAIASGLQEG